MKSKLIVFIAIIVLMLSLASCVGNKQTHQKNPTATFRSDNDDYVIPGIFIDVHEGEKKDGGDAYGKIHLFP